MKKKELYLSLRIQITLRQELYTNVIEHFAND